uniref:Uncharacterized protein n=1 Tax=Anguilla anguilla TaxID=7936 RepID=A0A0E9SAN3_ANGAN
MILHFVPLKTVRVDTSDLSIRDVR